MARLRASASGTSRRRLVGLREPARSAGCRRRSRCSRSRFSRLSGARCAGARRLRSLRASRGRHRRARCSRRGRVRGRWNGCAADLFTGFPWLGVGYFASARRARSHGYAPLGGVYGCHAGGRAASRRSLAHAIDAHRANARRRLCAAVAGALALVVASAALSRVEWTQPVGPAAAGVARCRATSSQEMKFDAAASYQHVRPLSASSSRTSRGRLIVLPETAFPVFLDEIPDAVLLSLIAHGERARRRCAARTSCHGAPAGAGNAIAALLQQRGRARLGDCSPTASATWCRSASSYR